MLRQFFHFLTLHQHTPKNIALKIPYPKIEKTVPKFLTPDEYNRLICHFSERADSSMGLRNLIIIVLLKTLGLRTRGTAKGQVFILHIMPKNCQE
jgi:integrase/recombinase XerC